MIAIFSLLVAAQLNTAQPPVVPGSAATMASDSISAHLAKHPKRKGAREWTAFSIAAAQLPKAAKTAAKSAEVKPAKLRARKTKSGANSG